MIECLSQSFYAFSNYLSTIESKRNSFEEFPDDLLLLVAQKISVSSLGNFFCACKKFNGLSANHQLPNVRSSNDMFTTLNLHLSTNKEENWVVNLMEKWNSSELRISYFDTPESFNWPPVNSDVKHYFAIARQSREIIKPIDIVNNIVNYTLGTGYISTEVRVLKIDPSMCHSHKITVLAAVAELNKRYCSQ